MNRKSAINDFATQPLAVATASRSQMLANDDSTPQVDGYIGLSNEFHEADDGWLRVAIYGETEHTGTGLKLIQVFDRSAANEIVTAFKAKAAELANKVKGVFSRPLFVGHPDNAHWCAAKPYAVDTKAYGWIDDVQARSDGLYIKPRWSEPGKTLLANSHYRFLSVHWLLRHTGGNRYRPYWLESAGLTNQPNIVGDAIANEDLNHKKTMNDKFKKLLEKLGFVEKQIEAIANEASDAPTGEQILAKFEELTKSRTDAETALANEKTAHESTKAALATKEKALDESTKALANETATLAGLAADNAVLTGKVTFAEREALCNELTEDFPGRFAKLQKQPGKIKTGRIEKDFTKSQPGQSNRVEEIAAAANEYIAEHKLDLNDPQSLNRAYAGLRKTKSELFEKK
jgi:hypothetical protein